MEEAAFRLQTLPGITTRQLWNVLENVSHVNLQPLATLFDEIEVEIADLLLRGKVEDFYLEMLLLQLLVEFVKVAVSLEDCPTLRAVLRSQIDFVGVKVVGLCFL